MAAGRAISNAGPRVDGCLESVGTVGVVLHGAVTLSCTTAAGRRATIALMGPGGVFGANPFGDSCAAPPAGLPAAGLLRPPDAAALVDSRVLLVGGSDLARAAGTDPATALWLAECANRQLADARRRLAAALGLPVAHRVLAVLLDLGTTHGRPVRTGIRVELPLTQDTLAGLAGATRESVNRALRSAWLARRVKRSDGRYVIMPGSEGGS